MKAALVLLAIAGCAGSPRQNSGAAPPAVMTRDPHAEITRLSQQIDEQRAQLALPEEAPSVATAAQPYSTPVSSKTDTTCHPAASQTCSDSCTIADTICDNADQICKLAADLAGDTWAAQKCDTAKQTCDAAHAKCCACAS